MKKALSTIVLTVIAIMISFSVSAVENCNHTYIQTIIQPTCTEAGLTTYTCTCGDIYTESTPAKGHNWKNWQIILMPTCTKEGAKVRYCWDCFSEEKDVVPATRHYYVEEVEEATPDADGKYFSRCAYCYTVEEGKERVIPKIATMKLSTAECTYNGKVRNPSVIVKDTTGKKLVEGTDFIRVYGGFTAGTTKEKKDPGRYIISIKFKGIYKGEQNLIFRIKPKKPTGVKAVTQDTDAIYLSWRQVTGATGYRIYQYSSSKGKYVKIDSVKTLNRHDETRTYNVKGLKAGTTYKFKIRPYTKAESGETIWGDYSDVFATCTKPAKTTLKVSNASGSKATLSWSNVSGENGYQVYYSTSKNGTYKKMKSVSANTVKYTTSKLTSGKTYYFKVRAYKKVDGKTIFGSFSSIKSVKIK